MSWCRNRTCGQPSESGRGCCALFETAEPTPVDNHRTNHHSKKLVSKWSSGKKRHKSNARVRAGFRKISNVSISRRTQMDCTNAEGVSRETTPSSRWCFVQQKASNACPPSDSLWGSQFDDGEDTREILDTSPQKTNKESNKWVPWV